MDEYYEKKFEKNVYSYKACFWGFIATLIMMVVMLLTSCKSIQYVPVPEYHHDSIYITKVQYDSIFKHDSVFVKEYLHGDTFYIEKTKWQTLYKYKMVYDTAYVERVDSVSVPYPVERKLSRWEQTKIDWGGTAFMCLAIIIFIVIWLVISRLKR